ncbi:MAG TPA: MBL fold metallo-hydrolase [Longimicrobium sp.]|nr:MBL fold metallo-hydrolase [Longimicrobium sp.]
MRITFLGAAGTVTGSKYLVETDGRRIVVDCGLFQGLKELRERNREPFAVDPASVDAVVLTHAHLDHSGWLPVLVREGFRGPVHCTPATADLAEILLADSAHLQEEEAEFANRHRISRHQPALPLYTVHDAERAVSLLRTSEWGTDVELGGGASARFRRAGHMPGAASVSLTIGGKTILFSGDLGRPGDALLPDPEPASACDWLLVESTYGDRRHPTGDPGDELAEVIRSTAANGGVVLIPAFAVGRAQELMYHVHRLKQAGRIPDIPIFVDSPMAARATAVFLKHPDSMRLTPDEYTTITSGVKAVGSVEESKKVDRMSFPRVIISASGMATGGRVLHHLKVFAGDPRNTVLFAGYQAAGTRGAQMVAGAREVKIHGEWVQVRCRIEQLDGLSAHADYEEILGWLSTVPAPPKHTFIVHGEPQAADALRVRIRERLGWACTIPQHRQTVELEG